jgi:peptidyl-dipeptidase Dcp
MRFGLRGAVVMGAAAIGLMSAPAEAAGNSAAAPFMSNLPLNAPRYDKIKDKDYKPAFSYAMKLHLKEIQAIANDPAKPTFENTIAAMEKSGALLGTVALIFGNMTSANTDDPLQKLDGEIQPKLQDHSDTIFLNPKLFARVSALYDGRDKLGLDAKSAFLLEQTYKQFVRAGAKLAPADQAKLRELNKQVAKLSADFRDRLLAGAKAGAVLVADKADLKGLSDGDIAAAATAAEKAGHKGQYLLVLRNTTQQPLLASLENRALRERLLKASMARGDTDGPTDQRDVIATLAKLRAEQAKLLGFPSFAAYKLDNQMAHSPDKAEKLMGDLAPAATAKARAEAADMQAIVDKEGGGFKVAAWDWEYYAEKVRKSKFDLDESEVKPYFTYDRVLQDGVFFAANKLYGFTFKERHDLPTYNADMRVFDVIDADGAQLAIFYVDPYARPNKQGGAWCNYLVAPSGLFKQKPVVVNVTNFTKPQKGEPALISFDDVTTMFHEFGHAIHAMVSSQYYPSQAGFNVPTDVVEFPSQFNEHWALEPAVFANYAKHNKTGAAMPADLVEKIKKSKTFNQGYMTVEYMAAALLDLEWHSLSADAPKQNADRFEQAALKKHAIDLAEVPPRYRSPYFLHIWGNGYESNYYAYFWGEVLDDDAYQWFTENGGLTRANGQRFRDVLLGPGYTDDPMKLYRDFRGAEPKVDALIKQRGLDGATN